MSLKLQKLTTENFVKSILKTFEIEITIYQRKKNK